MNTILCPRCDGTGGVSALSAYHTTLGLTYQNKRCDYCEGRGIVGEFTEVRLVTRASLCEICGCRSFKGKCTANKDFHDAHTFFTRRIREGTVYFYPLLQVFPFLDRYQLRCWNQQGAACGFETKHEQAAVRWVSLSLDEAQDLHGALIAEGRVEKGPLEKGLETARLVRETNLPLWEALNQTHCAIDDVLLSRTMGYPPRARRSAPTPVTPPDYWCAAIPAFVPTWLQSAWEMGYPTCYDEKDYEHLLRRPEVHGE